MPNLNCSVYDCCHCKDDMCCLENIKVGGSNAITSDSTECDNFAQKDDVVKKFVCSVETPSTTSAIECDACDCDYNNNCACTAGNVCICGDACCTCADTKCQTFKCTCK